MVIPKGKIARTDQTDEKANPSAYKENQWNILEGHVFSYWLQELVKRHLQSGPIREN